MKDITNNVYRREKEPKVTNLNVRNTFVKIVGNVVLVGCVTIAGLAHFYNKYPFVVDKEGRRTTEATETFPFRDDEKYTKNIYEFSRDESTGIGTVRRYNCNFHSYDFIEKLVETANEQGPDILAEKCVGPIDADHPSWYFTKSEQDNDRLFKVIYTDDKGDFVIEDESPKNNLVTTLLPVFTGALAGLLTYADITADTDKKTLSKKGNF